MIICYKKQTKMEKVLNEGAIIRQRLMEIVKQWDASLDKTYLLSSWLFVPKHLISIPSPTTWVSFMAGHTFDW